MEQIMHKITRICYNSANWQRPTGDATKHELAGTYNHDYGYGHEEWLFRAEWQIDGWRYAFLQGVNRSRASLVKASLPFDLTLYTIQPDKRRRYVATIEEVECLDDQQAKEALDAFKKRGWYQLMQNEIAAVHGDVASLGTEDYAKYVLNIRYRLENLKPFAPDTYAKPGDPILKLQRYSLTDFSRSHASLIKSTRLENAGKTTLPNTNPFLRKGTTQVECTPEHARMQAELMKQLKVDYPQATIVREQGFIDVTVKTANELLLYEIKSDLDPRTVIRQALGQILEYAYHPSRKHQLPMKLVIVGRCPLGQAEQDYLERLTTDFCLPIQYRVVPL